MKEKYVKIYEHMPEKERMKWYSKSQVHTAFTLHFMNHSDFSKIDDHVDVTKKQLLVYSEDYNEFLKGEESEFYGVKYECKIFYNYADVNKMVQEVLVDDNIFLEKTKCQNFTQRKDLRKFLNDRICTEHSEATVVDFYGDEREGIKYSNRANTFRTYYGLLFNKAYIDMAFHRIYAITKVELGGLLFLFAYKFFTISEWSSYGASRSINKQSAKKQFNTLLDKGYIAKFIYKNKLEKEKNERAPRSKQLYNTTDKADRICTLYMDYILYKRKIEYNEDSMSDINPTHYDIRHLFPSRSRPVQHIVYEAMYEWINYQAEVVLFDGSELERVKKLSSSDFYMNPHTFYLAKKDLLRTNGKTHNQKFIKKFLNNPRWGINV